MEEQRVVIGLVGDSSDDWNDLGTMEVRAGRRARARTAFERALALNAANRTAQVNLERLKAEP